MEIALTLNPFLDNARDSASRTLNQDVAPVRRSTTLPEPGFSNAVHHSEWHFKSPAWDSTVVEAVIFLKDVTADKATFCFPKFIGASPLAPRIVAEYSALFQKKQLLK